MVIYILLLFFPDGEVSEGYFIRKDWLDKLNLPMPETADEYYNALRAFREEDPNGNNKKDEVPFFARKASDAIRFVNLHGVRTGWYEEDGVVRHGQFTQGYKDAIVNVVKLYQEGLIDQEIFTRGNKSREELLGNDIGGSTHDWIGSTASYNEMFKDKVPGINFVAMAPPADVNGSVWEETSRSQLGSSAWGISYVNKHPEETIKYFDFWFSEEGRRLMNFGIEDVHYTMVDGKPKFKDEILNGEKTVLDLLNEDGAQIEIGFHQDFAYEEQWLSPAAKEGIKLYMDNKYSVDAFPDLPFTEEELKVIEEKWPGIETFMNETQQKWILGAESPEAGFDAYIKKLKEMGIEDVIKVRQTAYDRYNK